MRVPARGSHRSSKSRISSVPLQVIPCPTPSLRTSRPQLHRARARQQQPSHWRLLLMIAQE
eukprot:3868062-Alexandrium_andersonii.AAC.1